jgi:hypothetical protein
MPNSGLGTLPIRMIMVQAALEHYIQLPKMGFRETILTLENFHPMNDLQDIHAF